MNSIDVVALLPLAFAFIRGYRKGFVLEIFSFFALIAALIACLKITSVVMDIIRPFTGNSRWLPFFAYLLTFIGVFLLVLWIGKLLEKLIKAVQLGLLNKLCGAALSVLKACFIISFVFWLLDRVKLIPERVTSGSFTYRTLDGFAPKAIETVSGWLPWVKGELHDIEHGFKDDTKPAL